jgi:hypothetical protein
MDTPVRLFRPLRFSFRDVGPISGDIIPPEKLWTICFFQAPSRRVADSRWNDKSEKAKNPGGAPRGSQIYHKKRVQTIELII